MAKNKFTIGGLCSGVGGIELGFKQAGFDIAWANDMDMNCMITYEAIMGENHYIDKKQQLISNIAESEKRPKPVTVLAAGFPCQAFSIAGRRKGFEDARGTVIYDIIEFIKQYSQNNKIPRVLFLENVKNLKTHKQNHTYNRITEQLNSLGYSVYTRVLNSCEYSTSPQNRERTYMVCFQDEKEWDTALFERLTDENKNEYAKSKLSQLPLTSSFHFNFPKKGLKTELNEKNYKSLFLEEADQKHYYNKGHFAKYWKMLEKEFNSYRKTPEHLTGYQIRRVYPRANKNNLIPTLTANMGTGGHNVPIIYSKKYNTWRRLTPLECFKVQGYGNIQLPHNVADGQLYKQAGNSVTVGVIKRLARAIKKTLE